MGEGRGEGETADPLSLDGRGLEPAQGEIKRAEGETGMVRARVKPPNLKIPVQTTPLDTSIHLYYHQRC